MPMPCRLFILFSKSLHPINVSKYRSVKYSALCKVQFSSTVYVQFTIVKYRTVVYNIQYSKYYYFILYVLWGLYLSFPLLLFHFNFLFAFSSSILEIGKILLLYFILSSKFSELSNLTRKKNSISEMNQRVVSYGRGSLPLLTFNSKLNTRMYS